MTCRGGARDCGECRRPRLLQDCDHQCLGCRHVAVGIVCKAVQGDAVLESADDQKCPRARSAEYACIQGIRSVGPENPDRSHIDARPDQTYLMTCRGGARDCGECRRPRLLQDCDHQCLGCRHVAVGIVCKAVQGDAVLESADDQKCPRARSAEYACIQGIRSVGPENPDRSHIDARPDQTYLMTCRGGARDCGECRRPRLLQDCDHQCLGCRHVAVGIVCKAVQGDAVLESADDQKCPRARSAEYACIQGIRSVGPENPDRSHIDARPDQTYLMTCRGGARDCGECRRPRLLQDCDHQCLGCRHVAVGIVCKAVQGDAVLESADDQKCPRARSAEYACIQGIRSVGPENPDRSHIDARPDQTYLMTCRGGARDCGEC